MNNTESIDSSNNLKIQMEFYKSYHNNYYNKLIHFFCIPMIIISTMTFTNEIIIGYRDSFYHFKINFTNLIISIYVFLYSLNFGLFIGLVMLVYFLILRYLSNNIYKLGINNIEKYLFILGWVFQFIGHYIEGNRPALIDSLSQAFFQAPLFSLEFLFQLY